MLCSRDFSQYANLQQTKNNLACWHSSQIEYKKQENKLKLSDK